MTKKSGTIDALTAFAKTLRHGQKVSRADIVKYCQQHGTTKEATTISNTLRSMTTNSGTRKGNKRATAPEWRAVFFQEGNEFRRYRPDFRPEAVLLQEVIQLTTRRARSEVLHSRAGRPVNKHKRADHDRNIINNPIIPTEHRRGTSQEDNGRGQSHRRPVAGRAHVPGQAKRRATRHRAQ